MTIPELVIRITAKENLIELLEGDIRELRAALLVARERELAERNRNR